jgi:hypothetical protein
VQSYVVTVKGPPPRGRVVQSFEMKNGHAADQVVKALVWAVNEFVPDENLEVVMERGREM